MALINVTNIPPDRVPFIDERTGLVSRVWYRFFLQLFNLTGGGNNALSINDLQVAPPPVTIDEIFINNGSNSPPFGITLTSSPFTYQNIAPYTVDILVGGSIGGVTNLEFSRDGLTWYGTGSFYGQFTLSPFDYIRIAYTSAPTVTGIPR
jgi:hypothetical protein